MTPSLMPLRAAISLIVVPFMSPVSVNARLAAARIEDLRASAVSRRRGGVGWACGKSSFGMVNAWLALHTGACRVCTYLHRTEWHCPSRRSALRTHEWRESRAGPMQGYL